MIDGRGAIRNEGGKGQHGGKKTTSNTAKHEKGKRRKRAEAMLNRTVTARTRTSLNNARTLTQGTRSYEKLTDSYL